MSELMTVKRAAGFIEVLGYSILMDALDKACKSAHVSLVGIDCNNPPLGDAAFIPNTFQAKITGQVEHVKNALEIAKESAEKHLNENDINTHLIAGAEEGIEKLLSIGKVKQISREPLISPKALGIIDVQFFANAAHALDTMLKAGDVTLLHKELLLGGKIVTLFVGGEVSQVEEAVSAAKNAALSAYPEAYKKALVITNPHKEILKYITK